MKYIIILFYIMILIVACNHSEKRMLKSVSQSSEQWTGIAISNNGRIFVNYPRWSDSIMMSVAEIINGEAVPYPNKKYNDSNFVCVQSVYVDKKNRLWILDPANPKFAGVVKSGPKLYQVDLATDTIVKTYDIPFPISKLNSYLNDIRVDTATEYAFITDSNVGGIYVLNLKTGEVVLKLYQHISTLPEIDTLQCGKYPFTNPVHSDGIEISNDGKTLYYSALMGKTLYSVPTALLISEKPDSIIALQIKKMATNPSADGLLLIDDSTIIAGDLANNALFKINLNNGSIATIVQDTAIRWADSFAKDKYGNIYFTTSQIHLPSQDRVAYQVFKITSATL